MSLISLTILFLSNLFPSNIPCSREVNGLCDFEDDATLEGQTQAVNKTSSQSSENESSYGIVD